jgi:GNAT superfamily N-acetyltransferase
LQPEVLPKRRTPPALAIERVGLDRFPDVRALNERIFGDERVIQRLDRPHLTLLLVHVGEEPVAFKIGYGESPATFYSAKGGVLEGYRRMGLARGMLHRMMDEARDLGYRRFAYDTFPNRHPGMIVLGLAEGFAVTAAGYNAAYRDFRVRLERPL